MTQTAEVLTPGPEGQPQRNRLGGSLGAGAIVFMVVAAAAPLTVIGGGFPLAALLGNGAGAPAMFAIGGAILLLFAVGLATMSRFVSKPGAFFTYVGYGLGRPAGLAAAWIAILTYVAVQLCVYGFIGLALGGWVADKTGLDLPWWVWSLVLVGVVGVLGYRHIELSSKVLGVLLIAEVGIVVLLALVILFQGGADGISASSFEPDTVTSGSPGLALMFCMAGFIGFEATAIFRDEAREPEKTIPRATYGAVLLISVFYTFSSWAIVQGWGEGFAVEVAEDLDGFIVTTGDRYLGAPGAEIVNILLITSLFACILSFHNVITRYAHSMSNAGLLPRQLGSVHESQRSPHVSSLITSIVGLVAVALFAAFGLDPYLEVFTWFSGIATVAVVVLMALTCAAVIVYFARNKVEATIWHTAVAPVLGFLGLAVVTVILFSNFSLLLGDVDETGAPRTGSLTITFLVAMAAFPVFGLVQAVWLKRSRPGVYETVIDTISEQAP
ncbi:APC family permease [Nocardioides houyundeii]|uniref:APC family permease n=1 Tax=Nocardioides houyundeii TaxID=2045452 RepID=UPI000DF2C9FD|nr:APC family permease [Nocardioides houyundeii]